MREHHPYGEFIPKNPKAMIIGSFPIGKFSNPKRRNEIKENEIDFFFGGEKNWLWKLLGEVYGMPVKNKKDIVRLLNKKGLAVGDVIKSCVRERGRASDSDLKKIEWNRDLIAVIKKSHIKKVFFTSKKVKVWFEKLFPEAQELEKILLISPSGQSLRSLHIYPHYNKWLTRNPNQKKFDFILEDYKEKFETIT